MCEPVRLLHLCVNASGGSNLRYPVRIFFVGKTPVVVALAADDKSFVAFERPTALVLFSIKNDTLFDAANPSKTNCFNLKGEQIDPSVRSPPQARKMPNLNCLKAYQEFWHSWRTFNPETEADF